MDIDTRELLDSLLQGESLTPSNIDNLISNKTAEDLYLEYKHGKEISIPKKGCKTIREYLSGFANSAGGLLIIGVDESNWKITGAQAPSGHNLDKWASDCITQIAAYFSPPPRFQVVDHPEGKILIIAADRSANLVPNLEGNQLTYYLRIHDKTIQAPEYLISDLVLGRRQHPLLLISDFKITNVSIEHEFKRYIGIDLNFGIEFKIENQSLLWAENTQVGILSYLSQQYDRVSVSSNLLTYIDFLRSEENYFSRNIYLQHLLISSEKDNFEPFTIQTFHSMRTFRFSIPLKTNNSWFEYRWLAAIYIISKNSPPVWYQLIFYANNEIPQIAKISNYDLNRNKNKYIKLHKVSEKRPIVGWTKLST